MDIPLKAFFRFCGDNDVLVRELFEAKGAMAAADVMGAIGRHGGDAPAKATFDRLLQLRVLENCPGGDALYEMHASLRDFLGFLLDAHHLETPGVLRALVQELRDQAEGIGACTAGGDASRLAMRLEGVGRAIEAVRTHASKNTRAIDEQAEGIRRDLGGMSYLERYTGINMLWDEYLTPIVHLMRNDGEADVAYRQLSARLDEATSSFSADGLLASSLDGLSARLVRMVAEVRGCLGRCLEAVEPLYRRYQDQHRLDRGASLLIDALRHDGTSGLDRLVAGSMPQADPWRIHTVWDAGAMEQALVDVVGYVPRPPRSLRTSSARPVPPVTDADVRRVLAASLPVDDVMALIAREWPSCSPSFAVDAYVTAGREAGAGATYGDVPIEVAFDDFTTVARTLSVRTTSRRMAA